MHSSNLQETCNIWIYLLTFKILSKNFEFLTNNVTNSQKSVRDEEVEKSFQIFLKYIVLLFNEFSKNN